MPFPVVLPAGSGPMPLTVSSIRMSQASVGTVVVSIVWVAVIASANRGSSDCSASDCAAWRCVPRRVTVFPAIRFLGAEKSLAREVSIAGIPKGAVVAVGQAEAGWAGKMGQSFRDVQFASKLSIQI